MFLQEVMQHLEDRLEKVQCNWDFGQMVEEHPGIFMGPVVVEDFRRV